MTLQCITLLPEIFEPLSARTRKGEHELVLDIRGGAQITVRGRFLLDLPLASKRAAAARICRLNSEAAIP